MIPFGSSGGRQLTSTDDESRALSCSSSGGVEGPEGERRSGSIIRAQKWGLTAGECILSWWGIWQVVWRPSASSCPSHLGTGEGTSRATGEWAGAQVMIHGSREHDRVTGGNNVIKKRRCSPLTTLTWLTDRAGGQRGSLNYTWAFHYSQLSAINAKN